MLDYRGVKAIKTLSVNERPREKLGLTGPASLKDEELLAILLGSGSAKIGVHALSKQVLKALDRYNGELSLEDLEAIPGMGRAKSTLVLAALELSRRRIRPRGVRIQKSEDVLPLVSHWASRNKEHFLSITLNGAHEVIETRVVTVGLINSSQIHPREVFADAITDRACAIIVAHNHPSGDLTPSEADKKVTRVLKEAGHILGIRLLDHVIFSGSGFCSLKEKNSRLFE